MLNGYNYQSLRDQLLHDTKSAPEEAIASLGGLTGTVSVRRRTTATLAANAADAVQPSPKPHTDLHVVYGDAVEIIDPPAAEKASHTPPNSPVITKPKSQ